MSFAVYKGMSADPVGYYCKRYRQAKLIIAQTLLSDSLVEKADLEFALEKENRALHLCRLHEDFDAMDVARETFKVDREIDQLVAIMRNVKRK